MIKVSAPRVRPAGRAQTPSSKATSGQVQMYIPPVGGWVTSQPLTRSDGSTALVLDNYWPTSTSIVPRGGCRHRVTIGAGVTGLFQYQSGATRTYFAADATSIYSFNDATVAGSTLTAAVTGQTSGEYSVLQTQTDGGIFLTAVNGTDDARIYDGTTWQAVNASSTPLAITGVSTASLSHVWTHRERQFFIEKGTTNAWYLGVNSVAGAATKLPLAGVFSRGGNLLFGATWSSDSGSGMDDRCVFATDQGEFAVYAGGNPSDANDWSLAGVYDIGRPLGKNAFLSVGGDIIICTSDGLIPLSAALSKDPSQLRLSAISRRIEPDWRRQVIFSGNSGGWLCAKWSSRNLAIVAPKNAEDDAIWAANLETGAWSRVTGWQVHALAVLGTQLVYGDGSGRIYDCDSGGFDDARPFTARVAQSFDPLSSPGQLKTAHTVKTTWRHDRPFLAQHSVATDYSVKFPAPPAAASFIAESDGEWDLTAWDTGTWDTASASLKVSEPVEVVSGHGEALSVQIQITSAQDHALDCELASARLMYSAGGPLE